MMGSFIARQSNPVIGSFAIPTTGEGFRDDYAMRPRSILAANLKALMASRPDLDTLPKITAATGVSNGTLDRWRRQASSARIDELEALAAAFGLEAWELLVPPDEREALHHMRAAARELAAKYKPE